MKIYESEIKLGLKDRILANTIVKATCPVKKMTAANDIAAVQEARAKYTLTDAGKAYASYNDLYYVDTILVSSSMNKNDDCFGSEEIWRARHTPVDKPTNIAHVPDLVCGHMTRSWVLTSKKGRVIEDNRPESELPALIHLACSAVIYRDLGSFYQNEINRLILAIEADEMAVSMEAHFSDFDYALLDESTGIVKVVARNDETAWMSSLLRWFGGEGLYVVKENGQIKETYRIGRYLKGITFTGKGFVDNPANPDSIILEKSFEPMSAAEVQKLNVRVMKAAAFNRVAGNKLTIGSSTKREFTMSGEINPQDYAATLAKAMNAEKLEKENDRLLAMKEKLEEQVKTKDKSIADFEFGKKEYETLLEAAKKEKQKDDKEKAELVEQLKAAKEDKEKDEKEKKEKAEHIASLEKELAELKASQLAAERQTLLMQEGIEAKDAEAFVKLYANFNNEQFKAVAHNHIQTHKTKAAVEQALKDGKVTADILDKMKPENEVDAKKDKEDEQDNGKDKKSKSGSIFASLAQSTPKCG